MNATTNAGASKDELGLYQKFVCYRVDGRDQPGKPRAEARYFVLDYRYDPNAWVAAASYATTCRKAYPVLSRDIAKDLMEVWPLLILNPEAAAVVRELLTDLGVPADIPLAESPIVRLMVKYATCPNGVKPDERHQEARPSAPQAGAKGEQGGGVQAAP